MSSVTVGTPWSAIISQKSMERFKKLDAEMRKTGSIKRTEAEKLYSSHQERYSGKKPEAEVVARSSRWDEGDGLPFYPSGSNVAGGGGGGGAAEGEIAHNHHHQQRAIVRSIPLEVAPSPGAGVRGGDAHRRYSHVPFMYFLVFEPGALQAQIHKYYMPF